jgi:two-component system response regulator AtoC
VTAEPSENVPENRSPSAPSRGRVLVVDDEAHVRNALTELLSQEGHRTAAAADGHAALDRLASFDPDVVLTALDLPVLDGLQLLELARSRAPHAAFLVLTTPDASDRAVAALKRGAHGYLTKPLELDVVAAQVMRACARARLSREASELRQRLAQRFALDNVVGEHPAMARVVRRVAQVADSQAAVLLQGESGTGKALLAAALHYSSRRREQPYVRLHCAALGASLLEEALFGHELSPLTGALGPRAGCLAQAHGGTLFLEEVSALPRALQRRLLAFLQEHSPERAGTHDSLKLDVRIVTASHRDLGERVKAGAFCEDLFQRLGMVQLELPPLRARKSDITLLAGHFLARFSREHGRAIRGFSSAAEQALVQYPWPGNVRELENTIARAVVRCEQPYVAAELLPWVTEAGVSDLSMIASGLTMAELERRAILQTLAAMGGSTSKASELLGVSQRKIQYRLKEWGLTGSLARAESAATWARASF